MIAVTPEYAENMNGKISMNMLKNFNELMNMDVFKSINVLKYMNVFQEQSYVKEYECVLIPGRWKIIEKNSMDILNLKDVHAGECERVKEYECTKEHEISGVSII
ncbi:hypothetical protein NPIL_281891 [Nephila pilipes]|uniref:Uncharacterized protein n=1 Tax=Nephila pilipes TaxID=299642 RepID=A0A8X6PI87_NEPPI|nr:hypothetical protein NPIL_281891 [Nephila pilipes]